MTNTAAGSSITALSWDLGSPTVSGITPNSGQNTGTVPITNLQGTKLVNEGPRLAPVVKLTKSGQSDIVATNVQVDSPTKIQCTFDLTGKATGAWDVKVYNPHGATPGTLSGGFTVTE